MNPTQVLLTGAIQLPNGDLWRGVRDEERPDNVELSPAPTTDPDEIIAEMITSQKGEMLSCQWCGTQFSRKQLNELREHVVERHGKATNADGEAEKAALVAMLAEKSKAA